MNGGALEGVGQHGLYWSSNNPSGQYEHEALSFVFGPVLEFGTTRYDMNDGHPTYFCFYRNYGFSVRCSRE